MTYLALAVDDDEHILFIYERVLARLDFDVLPATDGGQAISILESTAPALLFLDMLLPRVNGREVLDYIKTNANLRDMYIVVISAHPEFQHEEGLFHEFMLKPVRPADIEDAARRAVKQFTR